MKRSGFFKVSMNTLRDIARKTKNADLLAGFLVMARHGSGNIIADYPAFTFTGAGVNGIKTKVGVGEARANGILDQLLRHGLIKRAPENISKKHFREARYELIQGDKDLELPHSFVDGLGRGKVADSPLKRCKDVIITDSHADKLKKVALDDVQLDVLVLLLEIYKATNMAQYGGINPSLLFRPWRIETIRDKNGNFEWYATPKPSHTLATGDIFQHSAKTLLKGKTQSLEYPDNLPERFWNAFHNLKDKGLIYEAVTMLDTAPDNPKAKAICTIRVNDYHASHEGQDPSLLGVANNVGFYTHETNDRDEPEQIRFRWPNENGHLIGIYRPRFRAINSDTGIWLEEDNNACHRVAHKLQEQKVEEEFL